MSPIDPPSEPHPVVVRFEPVTIASEGSTRPAGLAVAALESSDQQIFSSVCGKTDWTEPVGPGLTRASFGWVVAPGAGSRCTAWTYLANATIHPANLAVLVTAMLLVASHWGAPVLLFGLGVEAAFLLVVPRWAPFQRAVHECIDDAARAAAQRAREALILQIGEAHRRELGNIEGLLEKARVNVERRRGAVPLSTPDAQRMARLTRSYILLAVDHRAYSESLAMTNPETLRATIRSLEAAESAQPLHARPLLRRWLAIAKRRSECWSQTRASLESTGHQLATITELAYLLHQESLTPARSSLSAELDRILDDFEDGDRAEREVDDLGLTDAFEVHPSLLPS